MNQNWHSRLHNLPFNDMESYDIEKIMENTSFIDETNVHPTLSIKK